VLVKPKWWNELPLLPFMKICSYLEYNQVFGKLPRVCQHFNELLTTNTVGFEKIRLDQPSAFLLKKLVDEVSSCKSLDLALGKLNEET
jgi:hypothetical protein